MQTKTKYVKPFARTKNQPSQCPRPSSYPRFSSNPRSEDSIPSSLVAPEGIACATPPSAHHLTTPYLPPSHRITSYACPTPPSYPSAVGPGAPCPYSTYPHTPIRTLSTTEDLPNATTSLHTKSLVPGPQDAPTLCPRVRFVSGCCSGMCLHMHIVFTASISLQIKAN
jgi:hypothetical protein